MLTRRRLILSSAVALTAMSSLPLVAAPPAVAQTYPSIPNVTIFAAVPNIVQLSTGPGFASFVVAGLVEYQPHTVFDGGTGSGHMPVIQIQPEKGCGTGEEYDPDGDPLNLNPVTTDASGNAYFSQLLTFPPTDPLFTAPDHVGAQAAGENFYNGNCYPIGPDNTSWATATTLTAANSFTASGEIALPGESRWYRVAVPTDSQLTVTLNNLPESLNLSAFSDIGQAFTTLGGTPSLTRLSAEFAADTFSPSKYVPSTFIPSAFIPSAFIPSAFSPSTFIPSTFIPSTFIPSTFIPSNYSPSAFIPSAASPSTFIPSTFIPSAYSPSTFIPSTFIPSVFIPSLFNASTYSSAQTRSLVATNLDPGTATKSISVNTWQNAGYFYFSVGGGGGAPSPGNPFSISVSPGGSPCAATIAPIGSAPAAAANNGYRTVIVTDMSRITGTPQDKANLSGMLQQLAARTEVRGVVVDLSTSPRVVALNAQADSNAACPYAKNLLAGAVEDIIASYRAANPVADVVLAGADDVVPFFRYPDPTLLGNETGYYPPVRDSSASQASLRNGYVLSDDGFGTSNTIALKGSTFPVPDLPVGRLVETPGEISGLIAAYLSTTGGVVATPQSSLVTGYDFLTYPAQQVEANLSAGIGSGPGTTNTTLIAPRTAAPTDFADGSWNADQLRSAVLGSRHDIVFLAGHFSANDALAADYTTDMLTTDMEQSSVNLVNSVVFSAGCHSGYNIVNGDAEPGVTLQLDWPEEFARKQATLIAGTGYQYGDTDFTAYSEKIYAGFSHQLLVGTGAVSVGSALLAAKQDYLNATPSLGEMDRKALLEATLYGLPMLSINMPHGRITAPTDTTLVSTTTSVSGNPGQQLGLRSAPLTVTPTLTANSVPLTDVTNPASTVGATYLSGSGGVTTNPYQPVLPLETRNVSVPGYVLRGVAFRGGSYSDTSGLTPLTDAPATDIRGVHVPFSSTSYFPERLWTANYFGALETTNGATHLSVTPAQYISDSPGSATDTLRQYGSMSFQLFYSNNTSTYGGGSVPARAAAPEVSGVTAVADPAHPGSVDVCVAVDGDPAAGVQDTFITWSDASRAAGSWQSVDLHQGGCAGTDASGNPLPSDSLHWGAMVTPAGTSPANFQFMVQAVNGVGLVTLDDNDGAYYSVQTGGASGDNFCSPGPYGDITGGLSAPEATTSGSTITVSDMLLSGLCFFNGGPVTGVPVTFSVGGMTATAITDANGVATAQLRVDLPSGSYPVTATFAGDSAYSPASDTASSNLQVSPQPTAVALTQNPTPANPNETSFTAEVCASSGGCGPTNAPLTQRSVVFELTLQGGAAPVRTSAVLTDASGQAQFTAFGLPVGSYTLSAYFDGVIPNVGTVNDPVYAPSSATAAFSTSTADTAPPMLTVPPSVTVPATSAAGADVSWTASATDAVDPRPAVSCTPAPGTFFVVGSTPVTCTATDTAGNAVSQTFSVTVTQRVAQLAAGMTTCNGVYGGSGGGVTVPAGAVCTLVAGTTVTGDITVQKGGVLHAQGVVAGHDINLQGSGGSTICASTIAHNLNVTGGVAGSAVTLIGDLARGCSAGNSIGYDLNVSNNSDPEDVGNNVVAHDLNVLNNTPGGATVIGNHAGHNTSCAGNSPQVAGGNSAGNLGGCPA